MSNNKITAVGIGILMLAAIAFFVFNGTASIGSRTQQSSGLDSPAASIAVPEPDTSPSEHVRSFYDWYLQVLAADPTFLASKKFESIIENWLTPTFAQTVKDRSDKTLKDPLILAERADPSWSADFRTSIVSQTQEAIAVRLSLGKGLLMHNVDVLLVYQNGGWRIDGVREIQ